jgi:hypothetical protein
MEGQDGQSSRRSLGFLIARALCFYAVPASVTERPDSLLSTHEAPTIDVHHTPGHDGGPPWTRHKQSRDEWRRPRQVDREYYGSYSERRTVCRTTYRTYFDDYSGEYVCRSIRVCD